jgi:hypothetical protein
MKHISRCRYNEAKVVVVAQILRIPETDLAMNKEMDLETVIDGA